ncbi:NAD(P)/FAD-dependent oxidoreductase [Nitratifractor salsuginis]|uniref:FAD-dependent pyridine nucleotide-disulfide oxidoreductase n=1 Tax=Nitratifractor salsuginis (strain DSM 16511 / JCM 12458 / E9I37-1) TaxID=749222 RepID=E6X374_NITSE|nr:FAD-dependent oxidoreductase [Nitratifractor salsuginis]ADV46218.1 FAD-dependent pyridine nucleotide-disulfide oxidoreductase [Nitratifractor salsuginis DSM 16511]
MKISSKNFLKKKVLVDLSRRDFLKGGAALPLLALGASQSASAAESKLTAGISKKHAQIVIVGAGSGGIDAAARLRRAAPNAEITVIAPNTIHLYQSGQIFVAAGLYTQTDNRKNSSDLIPDKVKWIQDLVTQIDPKNHQVQTEKNGAVKYDVLVVATGAVHDFSAIEGLKTEAFGQSGLASVYLNDTLKGEAVGGEQTRQWLSQIAEAARTSRQQVLFSIPEGDVKAQNASLDVLLLGLDIFRGKGPGGGADVYDNVAITVAVGNEYLIDSKPFDRVLRKLLAKEKNLTLRFGTRLSAVDTQAQKATLTGAKETEELKYDFLHVAPSLKAPEAVAQSELALKEGARKGFVEVDPVTLQHKRYPNVFALGDVAALPAKSGAATRDMAIVIQDNVANYLEGRRLGTRYTGYTAVPVKTRYGREMLIEYDRKGPNPTFPLDPNVPRWIWWEMDLHLIRWAYFELMMRGLL